MLALLFQLIAMVPGLEGFASSYFKARFDREVAITTARIGGDVERARVLVAAQVEAEHARVAGLAVIAGNRLLTVLVILFALPIVALLWKVIGWDLIAGSFAGCGGKFEGTAAAAAAHAQACISYSTDPARGQVADIISTVVWAIFGSTAASLGVNAVIRGLGK